MGESLESCEQRVVKAGLGGVEIPKPCELCAGPEVPLHAPAAVSQCSGCLLIDR